MIPPTLLSARHRRCTLAAIAVCLGSSIAAVGPAQAGYGRSRLSSSRRTEVGAGVKLSVTTRGSERPDAP